MNIDNLVSELLAGKTSDELAAEMAEALNTAIKEKEEIEREAEEKRIAAEKEKAEAETLFELKKEAISDMIEAFVHYLELGGVDEDLIEEFNNMEDDDLADLVIKFDEAMEAFLGIAKLAKILDKKSYNEVTCSCKDTYINEELLSSLFGL